MDYTQRGVLNTQVRVLERLRALAAERNVRLDPGSPIWFDGRMSLPAPGEPWKLALSAHGESATAEFTPGELDDFLAGRAHETISGKLAAALDLLRAR